ncbi:MAG TPA: DnaD domain protein [Chloroflexi bacterium]|nr:DnaD domain protein [Chloroflexota bacterium]
MKPFAGFPAGKTRFTPIPDLFYTELLPRIADLAELKLVLYMFWALNRQRGYPRYMTMAELEAEGTLLAGMPTDDDTSPVEALRRAAVRAVEHGILLLLTVASEEQQTDYYFINTPQGRRAVEQVKAGELILENTGFVREAYVEPQRPRIVELYEQNIGLLQPLLAEELEEAELTYPADWIYDAFRIAAERNVRRWRYVKSILERWAREGKDDGNRSFQRAGQRSASGTWGRER